MATDALVTRLYNKKLLPLDQFKDQFLDYLLGVFRGMAADAYNNDGVFDSATPVTPSGNNAISIAGAFRGVTGTGYTIDVDALDDRLQAVAIPPDAATVYHVGLEQSLVEVGIEVNPRTGEYEYRSFQELIGRVGTPNLVTDNGNGTITLRVNSLGESGKSYAGRTVRVWLKSRTNSGPGPLAGTEGEAFETLTITYSAPDNSITTAGNFGQDTVSTTASDYVVMLVGPTVMRLAAEDLRTTDGVLFLAAVTSVAAANPIVTIDTTDQNVLPLSLSEIADAIEALQAFVTLLGTSAGSDEIGGALHGNLLAGTVQDQLQQLADEWGKLDEQNVWEVVQQFSAPAGTNASLAAIIATSEAGGATRINTLGTEDAVDGMNLKSQDFNGRVRWGLDHNGYPAGQVTVYDQNWMTAGTTYPEGWANLGTYGAGLTIVGPTVDMPYRHALFATDAGASTVIASLASGEYLAYADDNLLYVQEWDIRTGAAIDAGDAAQFEIGIQHNHGGAQDWFHSFQFDKDTMSNWLCHAHRTTGGDVDNDSGVAVAINTTYRMRIEVVGQSNRSSGSGFAIKHYINGVIKATASIDAAADGIRPYFKLQNPGANGPYGMRLSPVRVRFNHRLTPDPM